jgi:hypothetical protein
LTSNWLFTYRIREINGERLNLIKPLVDGTLIVYGKTKRYIIAINEDKGYQILYETNIPIICINIHDEKLVCRDQNSNISLWEKNEDGIYQKIREVKGDEKHMILLKPEII